MNVWFFIQLSLNLVTGGALFLLWIKFRKPPAEDPRLARGLQLLQSKISILEDLSDRTELQAKQLNALMDSKLREVHQKIEQANEHVHLVERSIVKSREVAHLFQDRIPHEEIIERKTTARYIEAARMAHSGANPEDIASQLGIPLGEVNLIAQMNREQVVYDESVLPEWAKPNHIQCLSQVATESNELPPTPEFSLQPDHHVPTPAPEPIREPKIFGTLAKGKDAGETVEVRRWEFRRIENEP